MGCIDPIKAPQLFADDKIVDGSAPLQCKTKEFLLKPSLNAMSLHVSDIALSGVVKKTMSASFVISQGILVKRPVPVKSASLFADEKLLLARPEIL